MLGPGGGEWEGAKHAKKKKTKIKEAMKVDEDDALVVCFLDLVLMWSCFVFVLQNQVKSM